MKGVFLHWLYPSWLVQSIQSKRCLKLAIIRFEGPMFAPGLSVSDINLLAGFLCAKGTKGTDNSGANIVGASAEAIKTTLDHYI